jgi:AhpD family alkylhydroperoxidase
MSVRQSFDPKTYGEVFQAMMGLSAPVYESGLDPKLLHLVKVRVSQLNGCGYCVDMHTKDARLEGETEQRLYLLSTWREAPMYTPQERAALAWAEAVTKLPDQTVPESVYALAREQFSEQELVYLTLAIVATNSWNRFSVAFGRVPGTYEAGSLRKMMTNVA